MEPIECLSKPIEPIEPIERIERIECLSKPRTRSNPLLKFSSAVRQPMRKLFKSYSEGSVVTSTATERYKTENIRTSNANMEPIKCLSQPRTRRNPFVKLSSSVRQPMRKLFKSYSEGSVVTSTATERYKTENITTSNANMEPIKCLSRPRTRSNPFEKLSSAVRRPKRKLVKSYSEGSVTSTASTVKTGTHVVKLVRFSEKNHSRKTLSRMNYTHEESEASWLSREDGEKISRQCHKEIKKIDDGKKFTDKKYCARGLEGKTRFGSIAKEQNRALAISAVLNEQWTQWEEGIFDEDTIAELYYSASSSCQLWASLIGGRDCRAAEEIHG
jgi:hypothetical protein